MTDTRVSLGSYLLSNETNHAKTRFDALAELFDERTFRQLAALGISRGWRCWEIGAGGPSVAAWMAERVGPSGSVVATDIDVRWIDGTGPHQFDVFEHDVAHDDPPAGQFDLVHARLVLIHVPDREQAMRRIISSLRPGGWLLIEDFDPLLAPYACPDAVAAEQDRANRIRYAFHELLVERGVDLAYGRKLPRLLREHGLCDVGAVGFLPFALPAARELEYANVRQVADALIAHGDVTAGEVDDHLRALTAGEIDVAMPPLVSTWGRRP